MHRMTRTTILAAVCVAALVSGYGAGAQPQAAAAPAKIPSGAAPAAAASVRAEPAQSVAPAQAANDDLEMELDESSGLPVPKRRTVMTGDSAPYRNSVHVETPLDLSVVLGFYRAVLSKRGWTEDVQRAVVKADRAQLAFATADGPGLLKAVRQGANTVVDLSQRDPDGAAKVGLLPTTEQSKVMLGNLLDEEAVITINNRTIKVAAGVARTSPDGPKIDLPPGKYKYTFKVASRAAQSEEVEIGADETWALLVAPGEMLPLHVY